MKALLFIVCARFSHVEVFAFIVCLKLMQAGNVLLPVVLLMATSFICGFVESALKRKVNERKDND